MYESYHDYFYTYKSVFILYLHKSKRHTTKEFFDWINFYLLKKLIIC